MPHARVRIGSPRTWGPDERLNALRVLGFDVPPAVPRLCPSKATVTKGREALARLSRTQTSANARQDDGHATPYAVVHPFGSTRRQWWPLERVSVLAEHFQRDGGMRTVLIGDQSTQSALPADSAMLDARGHLTIPELVGVLAGAAIVVSTDSGPFHIAGALERPLVGLFRARRPEHAERYPDAHVVCGEHAACARECEWDRCVGSSCRQLDALGTELALDAIRNATVERSEETVVSRR